MPGLKMGKWLTGGGYEVYGQNSRQQMHIPIFAIAKSSKSGGEGGGLFCMAHAERGVDQTIGSSKQQAAKVGKGVCMESESTSTTNSYLYFAGPSESVSRRGCFIRLVMPTSQDS